MGSKEPHRAYEAGSGVKAGKKLGETDVPPFLPDCEEVRGDLLDYAMEVEYFDAQINRMMDVLTAPERISTPTVTTKM